MKQFPYAQQIIWENDVEQLEWTEQYGKCWKSSLYVAKTHNAKDIVVGEFSSRNTVGDEVLVFITPNGRQLEVGKLLCWAKL